MSPNRHQEHTTRLAAIIQADERAARTGKTCRAYEREEQRPHDVEPTLYFFVIAEGEKDEPPPIGGRLFYTAEGKP